MATPAPRTWADMDAINAARLNTELRDVALALLSPPRCQAYAATTVACASGSSVLIPLDAELYDIDWGGAAGSSHSTVTNVSRVVIPYDGTWRIRFFWQWPSAPTATAMNLRLNAAGSASGGSSLRTPPYSDRGGEHHIERQFSAGDYVELFGNQSSGASQNISVGAHVTGISLQFIGS